MPTYSLLQQSLDQTIDRQELEEASVVIRSLARADCPKLHRELFGILISGLEREEAMVFQAELKRRNFPTDLVADLDLPTLHDSFQIQKLDVHEDVLNLADSMGRIKTRMVKDLVFISAGFVDRVEIKNIQQQHVEFRGFGRGMKMPVVVTEREYREQPERVFRLDLFFWSEPNRMNLLLTAEGVIFHEGKPIRQRDKMAIENMLGSIRKLMPSERMNSYVQNPDSRAIYPNLNSYEEEIRWHFFRLKSSS